MIGTLPGSPRAATCAIALALSLSAASAAAQPAPAAAQPAPTAAPSAPAAPSAAAPPAGYGQPPPGYGQPPPGYGYPPPGYGYPPPGYGPPPGGYSPPPGYGPPPSGYAAPQGGYHPLPEGYYPYPPTLLRVGTLPYKDGDPIPPGFAVSSRANRRLVTAGAITFGAAYLFSALVASVALSLNPEDGEEQAFLFVPFAGPFITIKTSHSSTSNAFLLILDGVAQVGGAAMFIAGFAVGEKYLQRTAPQASLAPKVLVSPGGVKLAWMF